MSILRVVEFVATRLRQGFSDDAIKAELAEGVGGETVQNVATDIIYLADLLRCGKPAEQCVEVLIEKGVSKQVACAAVDKLLGKKPQTDPESRLPLFDEDAYCKKLELVGLRYLEKGHRELALLAWRKLSVFNRTSDYVKLAAAYFYSPDMGPAPTLGFWEYFHVLHHMHQNFVPRTYLEVGVSTGKSIVLLDPRTRGIGIDPLFKSLYGLPRNVSVYTMTSDDFFTQIDLDAILNGQRLDMAFIDGRHLFEYALRDFIHIERHCHSGSAVLFHDTYPVDPIVAMRHQLLGFAVGDPWKILPCFRKYRPDLQFHTIAVRPSGLTIVRNLDPDNRVLQDNLEAIYAEFIGEDFNEYRKNIAENVNAFPMNLDRISNEVLAGIRWGV
ncbi:MAG: class I SAM-dependent methyltransferase [Magnetococcus sp. MYC-9]